MNVLESRAGRPLRLRPWVLLLGAAIVVAVVLLLDDRLVDAEAPGCGERGIERGRSKTGSGSGGSAASSSFHLASTSPQPGEQNVAPNATISLTFSAPVSLHDGAPTLTPDIAGKWVQTNATTLAYALDSPSSPPPRWW